MREDEVTLLKIVKDKNSPVLDRAEAIEKLCQDGKAQANIATLAGLSDAMISHLRTMLTLTPKVRKGLARLDMHEDACYLLANATRKYQERVLEQAISISEKRDANRAGLKGRRSPIGKITRNDISRAVRKPHEGG